MKNKKYLILFIALVLVLFTASFVEASEVVYPSIPGLPNINNNPGLAQFVIYWFGILIYIAGIISLISFTIGAIGLIMSAENPEGHGAATDRMKGAILGLVLTLASFIIIKTINPVLITPSLTPLPGVSGVFYSNSKDKKPVSDVVLDTSTIPAGYDKLQYCCDQNCSGGTGPALLVWEFPKPGLLAGNGNLQNVYTIRMDCNTTTPISANGVGSFRWEFETTGVYYCLGGCSGNMCNGYMSSSNTSSGSVLPPSFASKIKAARFVSDPANNIYYGAIFHQSTDLKLGGACNEPLFPHKGNTETCINVPNQNYTNSVDIFKINTNPPTSGNGVSFYSEPFRPESSSDAGYIDVPDEFITDPTQGAPTKLSANPPDCSNYPQYMCYNYTNVNVPDGYKQAIVKFKDKPGSIGVDGSYLIGIYSTVPNASGGGTYRYCDTFASRNVDNLKNESITPAGATYENLKDVYIIPTF